MRAAALALIPTASRIRPGAVVQFPIATLFGAHAHFQPGFDGEYSSYVTSPDAHLESLAAVLRMTKGLNVPKVFG